MTTGDVFLQQIETMRNAERVISAQPLCEFILFNPQDNLEVRTVNGLIVWGTGLRLRLRKSIQIPQLVGVVHQDFGCLAPESHP